MARTYNLLHVQIPRRPYTQQYAGSPLAMRSSASSPDKDGTAERQCRKFRPQ